MYSVTELSKMYDVTRKTMYTKLECEDIQPYLIKDKRGLKLEKEGLNVLNNIMADSRPKQEVNNEVNNDYKDEYIQALKEQISELKHDKERLYRELENQRMALLSEGSKQSKNWFKKLFN